MLDEFDEAGYAPVTSWAAAEVSSDLSGNGVLMRKASSETISVLHIDTCRCLLSCRAALRPAQRKPDSS